MDTKSPSHRLHLLITAPQHEALQRLSAESGAPVAELVRRALDRAYAEPTADISKFMTVTGGVGTITVPSLFHRSVTSSP